MLWSALNAIQAMGLSSIAFAIWLALLVCTLQATPLAPFCSEVVPLLCGLHAAVAYEACYGWTCRACFTLLLVKAIPEYFGLLQFGALLEWLPPLPAPAREHLRHARRVMEDLGLLHIADKVRPLLCTQAAMLFLCFYPYTVPWSHVVRLLAVGIALAVAHLALFMGQSFKAEELESAVALWLALRRKMRQNVAQLVVLLAIVVNLAWSMNAGLLFFAVVLGPGLCFAWMKDVFGRPGNNFELASRVLVDLGRPLEGLVDVQLLPYTWPFEALDERLGRGDKEQLARAALAGAGLVLLLTALSWLHWLWSGRGLVAWLLPLVLLWASWFAASMPEDMHEGRVRLGSPAAFLFGMFLLISAESVLTGHVLNFYLGSPLTSVRVVVAVAFKVLPCWCGVAAAAVHYFAYHSSFQVRWLLAQSAWLKDLDKRRNVLLVPYETEEILQASLQAIEADSADISVEFTTEHDFTIDTVDLGGLTKEWAARLTAKLVAAPQQELSAMLRKWDDRSAVYHLNYERRLLAMEQGRDEEDILAEYRKLGVVYAKCFRRRIQLAPLSVALVKFLLAVDAQKEEVGFEDLREVCPFIADSISREPGSLDFSAVPLPTETGAVPVEINTGFPDEAFHPPAQPTRAQLDALARNLLEKNNHFALPLMEAFQEGFMAVVDLKVVASLFTAQEVQQVWAGSSVIDLDDWRKHTRYDGCTADHPAVRMLWEGLRGRPAEQLRNFCQEITASSGPPFGGFGELRPVFTVKVIGSLANPQAHTCFNSLDLPGRPDRHALQLWLDSVCGGKR